jgi:trafficking protein particle complex subunit 4
MVVYSLWVINKAGGLVYQRNFAGQSTSGVALLSKYTKVEIILAANERDNMATLSSNEYLVLAGTLHGIHAITSRLSPIGASSGAQVIEGDSFKLTIHLTPTGDSLAFRGFVLRLNLVELQVLNLCS